MNEKIVDKIRKLLAKAADISVTDEERLSLAAKARELMLEYEVSPEVLNETASGDYILQVVDMPSMALWQAVVRQAAAKLYFCEMVLESEPVESNKRFLLFGAARHMEAARSFGEYLQAAIERKAAAHKSRKAQFVASFSLQAASVLAKRVDELIAAEKPPVQPGSNLPVPVALADSLRKALEDAMGADSVSDMAQKGRVDDPLALALGNQAGKEIALHRQVGGGPAGAVPKLSRS